MWSALRAISRLCAFSLLELNLNSHESDWVTTRAFLLRKSRFVDSQITRMELLAKFSFIVLAFPPNHKFTMCRRSLSTLIAPTTLHNARQCLSHKSFLAYLHITLSLSANPPEKKTPRKIMQIDGSLIKHHHAYVKCLLRELLALCLAARCALMLPRHAAKVQNLSTGTDQDVPYPQPLYYRISSMVAEQLKSVSLPCAKKEKSSSRRIMKWHTKPLKKLENFFTG